MFVEHTDIFGNIAGRLRVSRFYRRLWRRSIARCRLFPSKWTQGRIHSPVDKTVGLHIIIPSVRRRGLDQVGLLESGFSVVMAQTPATVPVCPMVCAQNDQKPSRRIDPDFWIVCARWTVSIRIDDMRFGPCPYRHRRSWLRPRSLFRSSFGVFPAYQVAQSRPPGAIARLGITLKRPIHGPHEMDWGNQSLAEEV